MIREAPNEPSSEELNAVIAALRADNAADLSRSNRRIKWRHRLMQTI